jgi:23S rRNA pseudouridine1911/1915/1917 synthase
VKQIRGPGSEVRKGAGLGPRTPDLGPPLFLDNHLLVVVKPAGLLAQADRTGDPDVLTLAKAFLKERFQKPGAVFLGLVHRLDRPVSGVMMLARTSKAAARLSEQFRARTVGKHYVALVEGRLAGQGTRVDWLRKRDERVERVAEGTPGAQRAALAWQALGTREGRTLVAVHLETGRAHQIRVQMAALGHPIAGDGRYGARSAWAPGTIALHSAVLRVAHPTHRTPMTFSAQPVWAGLWEPALASWLGELGT